LRMCAVSKDTLILDRDFARLSPVFILLVLARRGASDRCYTLSQVPSLRRKS
jgi:hypothetical protein